MRWKVYKMAVRAGFIGIIGQPNAGKSTLVNALVAEKVSIVTHKPQTTRQRISGIYSDNELQAIFLDAPGIVQAQAGLNEFLQAEYKSVIGDSDLLLAVLNLDAQSKEEIEEVIRICSESKKVWIAVISKIDKKKKERLDIMLNLLQQHHIPIIQVSAKNNPQKTQDDMMSLLKTLLPMSPDYLYSKDIYTTQKMRDVAAEMVREKCFYFLHQEIPYGLAVKVRRYDEVSKGLTKIYADIIIAKEGHKRMVIGKGGETLRRIGQGARMELEKMTQTKIYLELHVTVKTEWMSNRTEMEGLGYVTN